MMKVLVSFVLSVLFVMLPITSCEKSPSNLPKEEQIKAICELTTIEAYYNNLAKSTKKEEGLINILDKERKFWLEYEGYAKIGIDMSMVSMEVSDNVITIHMPAAEVQEIGLKSTSLDDNSYISADGGWFFPIDIKVEDLTEAVADAQKEMEVEVLKNKALFIQAEDKAKVLIENYINKLGEMSGIKYNIVWKTFNNASDNTNAQK